MLSTLSKIQKTTAHNYNIYVSFPTVEKPTNLKNYLIGGWDLESLRKGLCQIGTLSLLDFVFALAIKHDKSWDGTYNISERMYLESLFDSTPTNPQAHYVFKYNITSISQSFTFQFFSEDGTILRSELVPYTKLHSDGTACFHELIKARENSDKLMSALG